MKVIFLDIDGVLCTHRAHYARGRQAPNGLMHVLDREAVGLLNILCCAGLPHTEVRVVLISTWRLPQHPLSRGELKPIEDHLRSHGFVGKFHSDWKAPHLGGEDLRGHEVAAWLAEHAGVDDFLIIDDRATFLSEQSSRHVRPNYFEGLSWLNFVHAADILHGIKGLPVQ